MQRTKEGYLYSPSDLITFLENETVTWLDRFDLDRPGELICDAESADDAIFASAGDEHERAFLKRLLEEGRGLANIRNTEDAFAATLRAMREGHDVIYQARLGMRPFAGYSDFLVRAEGSSHLGSYHYEVWDTKLARSMKPYFAVQLCCYAEMLEGMQGRLPDGIGVVLGNGEQRRFRTRDYLHYYRAIKESFLHQQASFDPSVPPIFQGMSDYRHWSGHVTELLNQRDDLSLVANIRSSQIEKLQAAGIITMLQLAEIGERQVSRLAPDVLSRLISQARLQIASRDTETPIYEILPTPADNPRQGLAVLPPASPNDICFDIEGYPLVDGGLEYLLGATYLDGTELGFRDWWAHDADQERSSFQAFVQWAYARWKCDRSMHIYHYAPYETTALTRLMSRYACCEQEVDDMLRNGVFVDLYTVVRQGLVVGEPAYSLKNIEHLYLQKRIGEVATAGDSMVYYHRWLQLKDGSDWSTSPTLKLIRDYNRADCDSTWKLAEWLRSVQAAAGIAYQPDTSKERTVAEATTGRAELAAQMLSVIPSDTSGDAERWRVHALLAHLLEFHRRADKPIWREMFARSMMTERELIDDPECLGGLTRTARKPELVKRSLHYEFGFEPEQESKLRVSNSCRNAHDIDQKFEIETLDYDRGLLTFTIGKTRPAPPDRLNLIPDDIVPANLIVQSIERTVRQYLATGSLPPALADFLHRRSPNLKGRRSGPVIRPGESLTEACVQAALEMENTCLCIQGPPGSGKTHKAGQMIAALIRAGKRVGVASNGHRAISLLMQQAADAMDGLGIGFTAWEAGVEEGEGAIHPSIEMLAENGEVFQRGTLPDMVGGTAWVFSRVEAQGRFDYLFVDEAGQVSVANLLSMAPAASNIVLLGDQMQLNQPVPSCHPGESGKSVLGYLLQDQAAIPPEMGIFLKKTWRMRPELCSFISEGIYEGLLEPEAATSDRWIRLVDGNPPWLNRGAGLLYVPVEHEGHTYECDAEAQTVKQIVEALEQQYVHLPTCPDRLLNRNDILVVAPYNLQVRKLRSAVAGVRVGTVDKFQGQQAPIVIFSMTASEGDASPRGVEFLFSKNRLNVAISRAQILAIIVGSPKLARTRCSRIAQLKLVDLFCRAIEPVEASASVADASQ